MKYLILKLVLLWVSVCSTIYAADIEYPQSRYEAPIIDQDLVMYFVNKPHVHVEVSVEEATGRCERVIDSLEVEPKGDIPTTLAAILPRSGFLKLAINTLFKSGSEVLKISEALSVPAGRSALTGL